MRPWESGAFWTVAAPAGPAAARAACRAAPWRLAPQASASFGPGEEPLAACSLQQHVHAWLRVHGRLVHWLPRRSAPRPWVQGWLAQQLDMHSSLHVQEAMGPQAAGSPTLLSSPISARPHCRQGLRGGLLPHRSLRRQPLCQHTRRPCVPAVCQLYCGVRPGARWAAIARPWCCIARQASLPPAHLARAHWLQACAGGALQLGSERPPSAHALLAPRALQAPLPMPASPRAPPPCRMLRRAALPGRPGLCGGCLPARPMPPV